MSTKIKAGGGIGHRYEGGGGSGSGGGSRSGTWWDYPITRTYNLGDFRHNAK